MTLIESITLLSIYQNREIHLIASWKHNLSVYVTIDLIWFDLIVEVVTCDNLMIAHRKFIQFCTVHHFSQPDINLLASAYAFHQIQQKLSPEHLSSCLYITYGKIRTTNISNSVSLWLSQTDELRTLVHCVCVCKCEQWLFHCPSLSLSNFCVCFTLYIYFSFYKIRIDRIAYPTIFSVHIYVKPKNDDDNLSNTFTINQTKETILIVNGNIESVESFFFYIT